MSLTPEMERAWRIDEGERVRKILIKSSLREHWRKKILDIEECDLPDYERPLAKDTTSYMKKCPWRFLKMFIP